MCNEQRFHIAAGINPNRIREGNVICATSSTGPKGSTCSYAQMVQSQSSSTTYGWEINLLEVATIYSDISEPIHGRSCIPMRMRSSVDMCSICKQVY